jgi:hypothetical protein
MPLHRAARRVTAWIAGLAILLGALAPAVTHALQAGGRDGWVEVCTAQGPRWVRAGGDGDGTLHDTEPPAPATGIAHEHCAFCWLTTSQPVLPGAPPAALPDAAAPRVGGMPIAHLVRAANAWRPAQPRAPPVSRASIHA